VTRPLKILVVEDSPEDAQLEEHELRRGGLDVVLRRIETLRDLDLDLRTWAPDLVLSDFSLPTCDGLAVLDAVRRVTPDLPFIFVSGTIGEERAIEAMKRGATDYVVKDRLAGLFVRVKRALDEAAERRRRQELETTLRQTQKLDALGRLAGAVAHDFNNLLTAILSYGETALGKLAPDDPARADVAQIYRSGESAVSLTRQLLAFSRKAPIRLVPVDLNAVVRATTPLLERLVGAGLTVAVKTDPAARPVLADVGGLEQILLNLAVNARDAMPEGGTVTLETLAPPPRKGAAPGIMLRVSDTGSGIDAEILPRIFEPFFTTKGPDRGTGLGLSTVYGLVQTFNGSIAVASELGKGTTFSIHLPEAGAARTESPVEVQRPRLQGGHETILVAEDAAPLLSLVTRILAAQGYRVLQAADGSEAAQLFEANEGKVDLLLTDSVMPKVNGRELARKLRERKPGLKVILMSGFSEEDSEEEDGFRRLSKPFTPISLAELVRRILDAPPA
jgi:signal transduction histidine kinase